MDILNPRSSLHLPQQLAHAGFGDFVPRAQFEPLESGPGRGVRELLAVNSGCDEVTEPHSAVTGNVQARNQGLHLPFRHLGPQLPQPSRQLRWRQHPVPVLVEVLENIAQLPPAGIGHRVRQNPSGCPGEATAPTVRLPLVHDGAGGGLRATRLLHPGMGEDLLGCQPRGLIPIQHPSHELSRLTRDASPVAAVEVNRSAAHSLLDHICVAPHKWGVPAEDHVGDHTGRPHITGFGVLGAEHLGSSVVRCPHLLGQQLTLAHPRRQAKIDELHHPGIGLVSVDKILRLEVAMRDTPLVEILEHARDLLENVCSLGGGENALLLHFVKQITSCAKLHDQIEVIVVFQSLEQLHDTVVIHSPHELDLPHLPLGDVAFPLHHLFDGSHGLGTPAHRPEHNALASASKHLLVEVILLPNVIDLPQCHQSGGVKADVVLAQGRALVGGVSHGSSTCSSN
mmetsp:Transcript_9489/g.21287  ORF Transcript_9489/g.21287 Transcript_9489/m.21287 type:complete len:454 (-) Transcript_9489:15-1376(-)